LCLWRGNGRPRALPIRFCARSGNKYRRRYGASTPIEELHTAAAPVSPCAWGSTGEAQPRGPTDAHNRVIGLRPIQYLLEIPSQRQASEGPNHRIGRALHHQSRDYSQGLGAAKRDVSRTNLLICLRESNRLIFAFILMDS